MNHRVLELLKTPKNIQSEDLNLLKEEINSFPYVQNIRALYLYGVHLYDKENYQQVLSTTAAYTTDKKILYHLINGKIQQQPKPEIQKETEKTVSAENALKVLYKNKATGFPIRREEAPAIAGPEIKEEPLKESADKQQDEHGRILPPPREEIKHLYVNGERNRILFEGEENFLEDDTVETIDLESTLESGSIVTQKIEKKEEPSVAEENKPVDKPSPETYGVKETGGKEESVPETADEEEEIHAESEEKKDIDESGIVLQKQEVNEGTESHPAEHADSKTTDGDAVEKTEAVTAEPVEPERDAELSESDFHHIKAILDTLEDDSEKAEPDTEEFTPEIIIEKENTGTESGEEKVLDESAVSFHETGAFLPEVEIAAAEPEAVKEPEGNATEIAGFTPEKIIDEDQISSEKVKDAVEDESEVSFHETGAFLPEVEIAAAEPEAVKEPENQDAGNATEIAGFTPEKIIDEDQISSEKVKDAVEDESEVSFHETGAFLPEVEIAAAEPEAVKEPENQDAGNATEIAGFTPEKIIDEDQISSEKVKDAVEDESEVSFHETGAFLPEVEIAAAEPEAVKEPENQDAGNATEVAGFTTEKIINEDQISSEKVKDAVQDESEVSFHGTESFLPEVKIQANEEESINKIPQQSLSKHEDEMRRLIEEVEKKMKEKAASGENKKEDEPANAGHDISFAETQDFNVKPAEPEIKETRETAQKDSGETKAEVGENTEAQTVEQAVETSAKEQAGTRTWKPMSFDSNIPDSLLNKQSGTSQPIVEAQKEETVKVEPQDESPEENEVITETETEDTPDSKNTASDDSQETTEPIGENKTATQEKTGEEERVMNVSFFGSGWTIPQSEKKEASERSNMENGENKSEDTVEKSSAPKTNIFDSNVPGFINTWQSWLKIDRTEEVVKEKTELKNKVIETFIENNPRISQLKDESSFVIREKGDDISHLMTETLANLYFEQKLYTKAIKAFEILIKKTPEKKKYYEGKIQEIKDFRTKG